MIMKNTLRVIFLLLGSLTLLISCNNHEEPNQQARKTKPITKVRTETINRSQFSESLKFSGNITPYKSIPLSFKSIGTIEKILVDEGDHVNQGDLLAVLDNTNMQNAYDASLATKKQAQDAYDRLKKVFEKGSLPEIQWEEVKAGLAQAQAAERISFENLKNASLKSPTNGVIGRRSIEIGQNVAPGITVLELLKIEDIFVRISVPENEINRIKKNQEATITIPALSSEEHIAIVETVGVSASLISKTYEVKLRMKNPDFIIRPGMVCDITLNTSAQNSAVIIPFNAVIQKDNQKIVFVYDKKTKTAQQRIIGTGGFRNDEIEVLEGLKTGDELIVYGQHKLTHNQSVAVK